MENWVKQVRRDLHRIPEIGFDLDHTSKYIEDRLIEMGYTPISTAKSGWIVVIAGEEPEAIAFRADMDALSVEEKTGATFQSTHAGRMHACGHDGHMTMLLGLAKSLVGRKLKKSVVLIFQPAEEGPGGAKLIVEEGVFATYRITKIFGIHLYPGMEEGKFGLLDGAMMASNGEFDLEIQGKSAHGAQPHLGKDAILAASALIQGYNTIVSRDIDPLIPGVVTIGTITGGEARNIIPQTVKLSGTIRSFDEGSYRLTKDRMLQIDHGVALMYDVAIVNDLRDYYPPVINDTELYRLAKTVLKDEETRPLKPMMFAEDFAFYQRVCQGLFVMLGTRNEAAGYIHPLHSCYFNFNEEVLLKGIEYYLRIAQALDVFA